MKPFSGHDEALACLVAALAVCACGSEGSGTTQGMTGGAGTGAGVSGGGSGGRPASTGQGGSGTLGGAAGQQATAGGADGADNSAGNSGAGASQNGGTASGGSANGGSANGGSANGGSANGGTTSATFISVIRFDFQGENGVPFGGTVSLGYPAGVPNGYSWKFGTTGETDVAGAIAGRGPQLAGAAYDQVYQHRPGNEPAPNARVLLEPIETTYFSKAQKAWLKIEQQSVSGAAFAEDFLNNQATGADSRNEADGAISVRAGSNAGGDAGGLTGRTVADGPVGYNFHGFDHRFMVDWSDVAAILIAQVMSCIPDSGVDLGDCTKEPYIANVGVDSWASTTSHYDNFKTHGGVSGGRFKPVTIARQVFTNYVGPDSLLDSSPPPSPIGF